MQTVPPWTCNMQPTVGSWWLGPVTWLEFTEEKPQHSAVCGGQDQVLQGGGRWRPMNSLRFWKVNHDLTSNYVLKCKSSCSWILHSITRRSNCNISLKEWKDLNSWKKYQPQYLVNQPHRDPGSEGSWQISLHSSGASHLPSYHCHL